MNNAWRIFGIIAAFIFVFLFGGVIGGSTVVLFSRSRFQEFRAQREREQSERQLERAKQNTQATQLSQEITALRQRLEDTVRPEGPRPGIVIRRNVPAPDQFGTQLMQRFINQLQITPDQRAKIQPMVNGTAEELRRLRRDAAHTTEISLEHLEDQIATVLTPAQRDHFNQLIQNWRTTFQSFNQQQQERQAAQRAWERQQWMQHHPQGAAAPAGAPPPSAPSTPSGPPPPAAPASSAAPAAPAAQP